MWGQGWELLVKHSPILIYRRRTKDWCRKKTPDREKGGMDSGPGFNIHSFTKYLLDARHSLSEREKKKKAGPLPP